MNTNNRTEDRNLILEECYICKQNKLIKPPRAAPFLFICGDCCLKYGYKMIMEALSKQDMEVID